MHKVPHKKKLATALLASVVIPSVCLVCIGWTPAVYITNESGHSLTNVAIKLTTAAGGETVWYDAVLPGQTITVRRNTSNLGIGTLSGDSNDGVVTLLIAEDVTPTEKMRIGILLGGSYSKKMSRFW